MSTSVKHFRSNMTGAPTLNGVAGALIGVLDACLVNGFNLKTIDSLAVAAGVATASVGGGHGYEPDTVVLIAGATPGEPSTVRTGADGHHQHLHLRRARHGRPDGHRRHHRQVGARRLGEGLQRHQQGRLPQYRHHSGRGCICGSMTPPPSSPGWSAMSR